jgi:ATP-dependent protease ClpP protease subunit
MAQEQGQARRDDLHRLLFEPNIRINVPIDEKTLGDFLEQLATVRSGQQDLILELNTIGGDADIARRIAEEIRLFDAHSGRTASCVGKTFVYSAGVTILAAFKKSRRFVTHDTVLLIHERRMDGQQLQMSGPISSSIQIVREALSLLETGQRLETDGFAELVEGSRLTVEELIECIRANCYMTAQQCLERGLIEDILR